MEINEEIWSRPENMFTQWLNGIDQPETNTESVILKSIFFFNREKVRELVVQHYSNHKEFKEVSDIHFSLSRVLPDKIDHNIVQESHVSAYFSISPSYPRLENDEIIQLLFDNDQHLYKNLYEYEFPKIYWHIQNNSGSFEQAKDVFQDALVIVLEKIIQSNFDLTCNFGTYLFSICKNLWYSQLKKQKEDTASKMNHRGDYVVDFVDPEEKPDEYENIACAIGRLGAGCQKLLNLFYYEQQSWETIAEQLGYTSAANARNQKYKCLEKIRKMITDSNKSRDIVHSIHLDVS